MNVADKQRLYGEARRVLRDGGRLALWDALAGPVAPIHFPVPWADVPELSFLATDDELRTLLDTAGFEVAAWLDLTAHAAQFLRSAGSILATRSSPVSFPTFLHAGPASGTSKRIASGCSRRC